MVLLWLFMISRLQYYYISLWELTLESDALKDSFY